MRSAFLKTVVLLACITGCRHEEPNYCEGAPHNNCMNVDSNTGCRASSQCSGATPVCDISAGTCVQCTNDEDMACTGTTPFCGTDRTCKACSAHAQCSETEACLPNGSCADATDVAYVSQNGTDTVGCTKFAPCNSIAKALATNRPYVKVTGTIDEAVTINNKDVTLLADAGAKLTRTNNGNILVIDGTSKVAIYDLEISGASGTGTGILILSGASQVVALVRAKIASNVGGGISASGGALTVSQCTISGNAGGGISVTGAATFNITNNFIYRNGDTDNGTFGGVNLGVTAAGANRFEFNTVIDNRASAGATRVGGVLCDIVSFAAANNIVARNTVGGSATAANAQTLGNCSYPTSKIQMDVSGLGLASPDMTPYSYKLTATSSAIDQATTSSPIVVDHDGDARPQGAQKDIGADEAK